MCSSYNHIFAVARLLEAEQSAGPNFFFARSASEFEAEIWKLGSESSHFFEHKIVVQKSKKLGYTLIIVFNVKVF